MISFFSGVSLKWIENGVYLYPMPIEKIKKRRKKQQSPFVDIIVSVRKNKNISQESLAESIGMNRGAYGHIETGAVQLTTDVLVKVCSALGITVRLLLEKKEEVLT
jgi:DNA-binding XRE family transcriptional regulator